VRPVSLGSELQAAVYQDFQRLASRRFPIPGMGNYSPTKIAVAGLSDAMRRELGPRGVQVSLVEP